MEFYNIGEHCSKQHCNQLDFLPYKCQGCKKVFCQEHWKFQAHSCDKESEVIMNRVAPTCPLCNEPISLSSKNEDPNTAVDLHISNGCKISSKSANPAYNNICAMAGCKKKEVIPFQCKDCHRNFCVKHRHGQDHKCVPMRKVNLPRNDKSGKGIFTNISSFASSFLPYFDAEKKKQPNGGFSEEEQLAYVIEESLKTFKQEVSNKKTEIKVH